MKKDELITKEDENSEIYIYYFASEEHPNPDKNSFAVKSVIDYNLMCLLYLNVQFISKHLYSRFLTPAEMVQVFNMSDFPVYEAENDDLEDFYGEQIHFEYQLICYYEKELYHGGKMRSKSVLHLDKPSQEHLIDIIGSVYKSSSNHHSADVLLPGEIYSEWIPGENRDVDSNEMIAFFEDKLFRPSVFLPKLVQYFKIYHDKFSQIIGEYLDLAKSLTEIDFLEITYDRERSESLHIHFDNCLNAIKHSLEQSGLDSIYYPDIENIYKEVITLNGYLYRQFSKPTFQYLSSSRDILKRTANNLNSIISSIQNISIPYCSFNCNVFGYSQPNADRFFEVDETNKETIVRIKERCIINPSKFNVLLNKDEHLVIMSLVYRSGGGENLDIRSDKKKNQARLSLIKKGIISEDERLLVPSIQSMLRTQLLQEPHK